MGEWQFLGTSGHAGRPSMSFMLRVAGMIAGVLMLLTYLHWQFPHPELSTFSISRPSTTLELSQPGRLLRISMVYGKSNHIYERALRTHENHSKQWGNGFEVLRQDLATGFWNKPTFILHVLTQELMKAPRERAEWLMWVDADSIIINSDIPPELFLPPADLSHIHFVGTRDENGLNTGIFYLRVSTWSVSFLVETLAMPLYEPDAGLGRSADQDAMNLVLHKETGGPENQGYLDAMVFVPRLWINTYEREEDGYEGKKGDMLVHFPGLEETRWKHMADWLDVVESRPEVWRCALNETEYWNGTREYWSGYRAAYELWQEAELLQGTENSTEAIRNATTEMKTILETEADDLVKLSQVRSKLSSYLPEPTKSGA